MQKDMDHLMLIIPASSRFLTLVRRAINTLVSPANLPPMKVFELQLAATEACNLFAHVYNSYEDAKTISISARYHSNFAKIVIDDGANARNGERARRRINQNNMSLEGELALKTARAICNEVNLQSGITGGLRVELTKYFDHDPNSDLH